ncbi:hypothetical protein CCAX7_32230 [Capsulimonas corticalis]|uniref:Uncharacterized protein n=1 Tax=Capsulimonas corticalis TaxID=2219043 RepID=A0A402D436_9BACT|nr:hypothetical protein [Capsulimonas corticalis]BDI31172.1 hypothetical protein CCAX7_32230 [Capsulimonas corticalis]
MNIPSIRASEGSWRKLLAETLPLFGHRNWIVVADSAYPSQSQPGVRTIAAPDDHLDVIDGVLTEIDRAGHVRPILHLDEELEFLSDEDIAGVGAFRAGLAALLGAGVRSAPHESIIHRLDAAAGMFEILVIKTSFQIPYTSVFIELDCGYWDAESERRLRMRMESAQANANAVQIRYTAS